MGTEVFKGYAQAPGDAADDLCAEYGEGHLDNIMKVDMKVAGIRQKIEEHRADLYRNDHCPELLAENIKFNNKLGAEMQRKRLIELGRTP